MLLKEQWMQIHVLKSQGLSLREIERQLGVSPNTVGRYPSAEDVPRYKARQARPTKLDPFHDYVRERVQAAMPDRIAGPALLRELRAQGYPGVEDIRVIAIDLTRRGIDTKAAKKAAKSMAKPSNLHVTGMT